MLHGFNGALCSLVMVHRASGELVVRFDVLFPKYISEDKKAKLRNLLAHPAAAH